MQIPLIPLEAHAAAGKQILANPCASSSPVLRKEEDKKVEGLYKNCVKSRAGEASFQGLHLEKELWKSAEHSTNIG